jgi:hypothetical protein
MENNTAPSDELLNNVSALSEMGNTIEQAATMLKMSVDEFVTLLRDNAEARSRWERGGIESENELKAILTRQAKAGSVQAAAIILKMRGLDKPEKVAPVFLPPPPAPEKAPAAPSDDWLPIGEVADLLKVAPHTIRKRLPAEDGRVKDHPDWPPLEVRKVKGKRCVSARAVSDHFVTYGTRRPEGFRALPKAEPPATGQTQTGAYDPRIDPEIIAALGDLNPMEMDPSDLSKRLLMSGKVELAKVRLAIMWADSHQRQRTAEMKAAAMFTASTVRKMVRAHADLIVDEVDSHDKEFAEELLRYIATNFPGVDLVSRRHDAMQLLCCFYREDMNRIFQKLESRVKGQMQEIRDVECKASEPAV